MSRWFRRVFVALAAILVVAPQPAPGLAQDEPVVIEIFWGDGCPFCELAIEDLTPFAAALPEVELRLYEVWFDPANRALMHQRADELGVRADAVPFIVVGTRSWLGWTSGIAGQVRATVLALIDDPDTPLADVDQTVVEVPLLGDVDLAGRSLLLSTVLIAFVDGFNPCSLWVLTVLLGLVLNTGSRSRVLLVGGTFLLVTTLIYGAFIVGVYSTLSYVGALSGIRAAVAVFAVVFGLVNVKDYLWFRVGPSLTIPDESKPGIYRRMRRVLRPGTSAAVAVGATVVLAGGVALVELPCTAGFPVIWSNLVNSAGVSPLGFVGLLAVYLLVYLMDELLVFGAAVVTMRATRLQERHGRALKLVGGMVMVVIGLTIAFAPETMDTIAGVLVVFGLALLASAAVAGANRLVRAA